MLQPFDVAQETLGAYRSYVRSSFPLRDPVLDAERERLVDEGLLWADTYVSLARPGTTGPKLESLHDVLSAETLALPWGFEDLYAHQHRAIERLVGSRPGGPVNTLILSGTGSGKTESFLIPIVDACLRSPGPGVKAVVLYPMNALANDQLKRLRELLAAAPGVTFGRYTGDAPEKDTGDSRRQGRPTGLSPNALWSREAMRANPPNILLTNYAQLEYMLLRGKDAEIFRYGPPRYLVVDEIHLFAGVLGAEVACLLRRLRQHTGADPKEICCVGTSATAGADEQPRLLSFAGRFFGAPFGNDAAIAETPAPLRPVGSVIPPPPAITDEGLAQAGEPKGLAELARLVFGITVPDDDDQGSALGQVIDDFATVGIVERALDHPSPILAAADALGALEERRGVVVDALRREAMAIVLLGAAARSVGIGEQDAQPRFRPRVHQIARSLAGLWRCMQPGCGRLAKPGRGKCLECEAATLPLASCRTCGEAYWTGVVERRDVRDLGEVKAIDRRRDAPAVFLADPDRLREIIDEYEDGELGEWIPIAVCPHCRAVSAGGPPIRHLPGCPGPSSSIVLLASTDDVHCPSCGDQGARARPILLPLRGSAAASVAVLTQTLADALRVREGEAGGRLLVFADSRQDAAQQAGYADDQGARVAVRQLLVRAVSDGPKSLSQAIKDVQASVVEEPSTLRRWLIGESERNFAEIAHPDFQPSTQDEDGIRRQLEWEIALEVTERARRRFSLEREGIVAVDIDRVDDVVATVLRSWPDQPFGGHDVLREIVRAFVDVMRYVRAVDHWMLQRSPRALIRNHQIRIGDRGVTSTRGFAYAPYRNAAEQIDIRRWTAPRNATRLSELMARILNRRATETNDVVEALASRLHAAGLLAEHSTEGRRKRLMVDHHRLVLVRDDRQLWRCDRCGSVRSTVLRAIDGRALCVQWHCRGEPIPFMPSAERGFYRGQYLSDPRRLIVREHSGQIEGDERLALEERFNDRDHPSVDVLACTPTLEVGVSLDDLHAVILRNLPPTPANYAQRVGRAGRRSKVALTVGHAGQSPHDTYFFERPNELIAGLVRAPAISLDNEPLLRRHVNSLVLETLACDLPTFWVPPIDAESFGELTVADQDGVIRETTLKSFADRLAEQPVRRRVLEAVRGAFCSSADPAPPADAERICDSQVESFLDHLRESLNRWCERYRALLDELGRIRRAKGVRSQAEREQEDRLEDELRRMASPKSPEQQPLGFLGMVGFLPRYGFTGQSVMLYPPRGQEPIVQAGAVAVTEFAPGNLVYARGRKLKIRRIDPPPRAERDAGPEGRENIVRQARRCDDCEFLTFDLLVKACPTCGQDLVAQRVLELTGVRGSGQAISSEDEFRARYDYDVAHILGAPSPTSQIISLGGLTLERSAGREIVVANRGPRQEEDRPRGFDVCTGCGYAVEAQDADDEDDEEEALRGHAPRCPGRNDPAGEVMQSSIWLTARVRGDVMEIVIPIATRGSAFASWRVSLAEALRVGIQETMQAGRRDIEWFERKQNAEPYSIVVYDTMPGGTGYMPKLFAGDADGLRVAAAEALRRLEGCDCTSSCHRCLRDFWNQRQHELLNRFEAMATLRRLAEREATPAADPENEQLESFLELEFFEKLQAAGLPKPTLQVVRELGSGRITRVDAEYRDPDVSIYLDGRGPHTSSVEKIADDLERRNALEGAGILLLEFTFHDVMGRFEEVGAAMRRALGNDRHDPEVSSASLPNLPELKIRSSDTETMTAEAAVDAEAWTKDESARRASLASANRLRLAGWRLTRVPSRS